MQHPLPYHAAVLPITPTADRAYNVPTTIMTTDIENPFQLFGTDHLLTMLLIAVLAITLPLAVRRTQSVSWERGVAAGIGLVLLLHETFRMVFGGHLYGLTPAERLPLHLCGVTLFLVVYMLLRRNYPAFEVAYFWAMGGTLQAILTPDLREGFPAPLYIVFFINHGLVMVGVAYAIGVYRFRPTLRSVAKTLAVTVAYAAVVGVLNPLLDANYLYLRHKPEGASLLDHLGPWPWYLLSLFLATVLFCLLYYLPFAYLERRSVRRSGTSHR